MKVTTTSLVPAPPARTRAAISNAVKRTFDRRVETRYVAFTPQTSPFMIYGSTYPSGAGAIPQLYPVLPAIPQGDGDNQRQGVKVSPVSHKVDLTLTFNNLAQDVSQTGGLDACAWDITAHVWYGYARRYKSVEDISVVGNQNYVLQNMFDVGNGTSTWWDGRPYDDQLRINKDVVVVKHKKVRMFRPFGTQNQATLGGALTTYFPQKIAAQMRLSFKPPATLKYAEGEDTPENYAPFIVIGYQHNANTQASDEVRQEGQPITIANSPALIATFRSHLWYKDA